MRGRKPLPAKILELRGNPGKRPLDRSNAPNVPVLPRPSPFVWLDRTATEEWERMTAVPLMSSIVTALDLLPLAAYCAQVSLFQRAHRRFAEIAERDEAYGGLVAHVGRRADDDDDDEDETLGGEGRKRAAKTVALMHHPLQGVQSKAAAMMVVLASEFGATPLARKKVAEPQGAQTAANDEPAREEPPAEDRPRPVDASAPEFLCPVAAREWSRLIGPATTAKLVGAAEHAAFAAYCTEAALFIRAHAALARLADEDEWDGLLTMTSKGTLVRHPLVGAHNAAVERMLAYAQEFGFTPSARRRIDVAEDPAADRYARFRRKPQ